MPLKTSLKGSSEKSIMGLLIDYTCWMVTIVIYIRKRISTNDSISGLIAS